MSTNARSTTGAPSATAHPPTVGPVGADRDLPTQSPSAVRAIRESPPCEPPLYSPEFVRMIQTTAAFALRDWLQANHIPSHVIVTLDDLLLIASYLAQIELHPAYTLALSNRAAAESISALSRNIIALGGQFATP